MLKVYDRVGREITVGSFIVYATASCSIRMHIAKVLSIVLENKYRGASIRIVAKRSYLNGTYRTTLNQFTSECYEGVATDIHCEGNTIVLLDPTQIPKDILDILDKEH